MSDIDLIGALGDAVDRARARRKEQEPMSDRYVVKRRRTIDGVEVTSVLTRPLPELAAYHRLDDLNAEHQDPGNYYIERWEERA